MCLVKDAESLIKPFIDHYFSLGIKHIVFLDNGSTDNTIAVVKQHTSITILETRLPYKDYQFLMKAYLVKRFAKNRWCLNVDIDEFFNFPFSDLIGIKGLLQYLNTRGYTAVAAHMLDMFSDKSLQALEKNRNGFETRHYQYYHIKGIAKERLMDMYRRYGVSNRVSNDQVKFHMGGIHKLVFGMGNIFLTKHPLVKCAKGIDPCPHAHFVHGAYIADMCAVLFHYLFIEGFMNKASRIAENRNYGYSQKYINYSKILSEKRNLMLIQDDSKKYQSTSQLIDDKFLFISDEFRKWVQETA